MDHESKSKQNEQHHSARPMVSRTFKTALWINHRVRYSAEMH
jgi:hypothetical protein